jgi:hypothetical protein
LRSFKPIHYQAVEKLLKGWLAEQRRRACARQDVEGSAGESVFRPVGETHLANLLAPDLPTPGSEFKELAMHSSCGAIARCPMSETDIHPHDAEITLAIGYLDALFAFVEGLKT